MMNLLEGTVRSFAESLGIGPEEIAALRRLLDLGEHDEASLKEIEATLTARTAEIVDRFYRRLQDSEETAAILEEPGLLARLKTTLAAYTHGLLAGPYGLDYAMHRVRVGIVHQRTGVKPRTYLAAWCHYLRLLLDEAFLAHGVDAPRLRSAVNALVKVAFLDIDLSLHTYLQADREASEERFRDLLESLDAVVWEAEADPLRFTFVNHRAEQVLGYPAAQWIEEPDFWAKRLHPSDRERTLCLSRQAVAEGRDHEFECRAIAQDGRVVWLHARVHVVRPRAGDRMKLRGVMVDVTASRRLDEQVRQWQKMDALGRLSAWVTHEINNQLGAVAGFAEEIARRTEPTDPRRDLVEDLLAAVRRAGTMTRPLLSLSRAEAEEAPIVELGAAIAEIQGLLRGAVGRTSRLVIETAPGPCPVKAGTGQIAQILLNLVLNARDAMPDGGTVTLRTEVIEPDARWCVGVRPGRCSLITVADTGCGMDEAAQARLFEPFFTTKAPGKGTGLGLSAVYAVVRQLGGSISVESEPGRGSSFRVWLPLA